MEVELDAAPLPPRTSSVERNDQEQEYKGDAQDTSKVNPQTPPSGSRDGMKSGTKQGSRSKGFKSTSRGVTYNSFQITGGNGITIGNVINIALENKMSKTGTRTENEHISALKTLREEASDTDLLTISECIDDKELQSLCEHLEVIESEVNRVKFNYGQKGISEVIYQTLQVWKQQNTNENQGAMLNILCYKLWLIGTSGCKEAICKLHKAHFKSGQASKS